MCLTDVSYSHSQHVCVSIHTLQPDQLERVFNCILVETGCDDISEAVLLQQIIGGIQNSIYCLLQSMVEWQCSFHLASCMTHN